MPNLENLQQGDIIIAKHGGKRKVLGVCGEVYLLSLLDIFTVFCMGRTIVELQEDDYTKLEEKKRWVPKEGSQVWILWNYGEILTTPFIESEKDHQDILKMGMIFPTKEAAEARKAQLIKEAEEREIV